MTIFICFCKVIIFFGIIPLGFEKWPFLLIIEVSQALICCRIWSVFTTFCWGFRSLTTFAAEWCLLMSRERSEKKGGGRESADIRKLPSAALLFTLLPPRATHHSAKRVSVERNLFTRLIGIIQQCFEWLKIPIFIIIVNSFEKWKYLLLSWFNSRVAYFSAYRTSSKVICFFNKSTSMTLTWIWSPKRLL